MPKAYIRDSKRITLRFYYAIAAIMTLDQYTYQPGNYQVTTQFVSKKLHQTVTNNVKVK